MWMAEVDQHKFLMQASSSRWCGVTKPALIRNFCIFVVGTFLLARFACELAFSSSPNKWTAPAVVGKAPAIINSRRGQTGARRPDGGRPAPAAVAEEPASVNSRKEQSRPEEGRPRQEHHPSPTPGLSDDHSDNNGPARVLATSRMSASSSVQNESRREENITCSILSVLPHDSGNGKPIRQQCPGPFGASVPSAQRRLAILVRGESYRGFSGTHDRHIDVDNATYSCQKVASTSHVQQLIKPFESCGYHVDIFISTWKAHDKHWGQNSSQQMIDMYDGHVADASFMTFHGRFEDTFHGRLKDRIVKTKKPQAMNFDNGFARVWRFSKAKKVSWDAILIVRSDLIFKTHVLKSHVPWHKIMFAFREWMIHWSPGNMVADTIHYFPWRYANCGVLEGFRDEFSASVEDRTGRGSMGFLVKTRHDGNAMADRNPLYKMCRPEQKYDINGGFAIFIFSMEIVTKKEVEASGASVRKTLFSQGHPRALPAQDVYAHIWVAGAAHKKHIEILVHRSWGQAPAARTFEFFNTTLHANFSQTSGWKTGKFSMRRSIAASTRSASATVMARQEGARMYSGIDFRFDRIMIVRIDYVFKHGYISAFECETSKNICVGYGAAKFPTIPVIVIASHASGLYFLKKSKSLGHLLEGKSANATKFLEEAFGMPIRVVCERC